MPQVVQVTNEEFIVRYRRLHREDRRSNSRLGRNFWLEASKYPDSQKLGKVTGVSKGANGLPITCELMEMTWETYQKVWDVIEQGFPALR